MSIISSFRYFADTESLYVYHMCIAGFLSNLIDYYYSKHRSSSGGLFHVVEQHLDVISMTRCYMIMHGLRKIKAQGCVYKSKDDEPTQSHRNISPFLQHNFLLFYKQVLVIYFLQI